MKVVPIALCVVACAPAAILGFAPSECRRRPVSDFVAKLPYNSFTSSSNNNHRHPNTSLHMSSRTSSNRDFYSILGVARSADAAEIKSAYRKLAKKYHPDANPGKDTTTEFQEVNRAYEVLSDADQRKKYDMFGEAGVGSSAASEGGGPYGYGSPFGGAGFSQEVDLGDIFVF